MCQNLHALDGVSRRASDSHAFDATGEQFADDHVVRTDHGDPLEEDGSEKDPTGDDSIIFERDGQTITKILWVKTEWVEMNWSANQSEGGGQNSSFQYRHACLESC